MLLHGQGSGGRVPRLQGRNHPAVVGDDPRPATVADEGRQLGQLALLAHQPQGGQQHAVAGDLAQAGMQAQVLLGSAAAPDQLLLLTVDDAVQL